MLSKHRIVLFAHRPQPIADQKYVLGDAMWLALCFPHWALDCRPGLDDATPALVVETVAQRQQIIAANHPALAVGVRRGMGLADARTRLAAAHVQERRVAAEQAALERLAGWAWRYSNAVHIAVADAAATANGAQLALEIGASLRLFGGRRRLLAAIKQDLNTFGYRYRAGVAVSPQAAFAMARAPRRLRRAGLARLPIRCLDLAPRTAASLAASGIHETGALLALPPAALARRYGPELLAYLERLRGRVPHGLALHRLPERYRSHHELIGAVETTQGLVFVLRRVFVELAAFLRGADSAIQTLRLTLVHEREQPTHLTLRLAAPSHDAAHLERVAGERLSRIMLVAPVLEIGLISDRLRRSEHAQDTFWKHAGRSQNNTWPAVLDRLRARLGHDAVGWLVAPADHRPEIAAGISDRPPTAAANDPRNLAPRPLWLLDSPQPISDITSWLIGPERIETGWWQAGIRRDYFRACDTSGRLVWVFRDLQAGPAARDRYYLHGLFG